MKNIHLNLTFCLLHDEIFRIIIPIFPKIVKIYFHKMHNFVTYINTSYVSGH